MNMHDLTGSWSIMKGKAMQYWGRLLNEDLLYEEGKREELTGQIHKSHGDLRVMDHEKKSGAGCGCKKCG